LTPMSQPPVPSLNAFMLPKPPVLLMPSSTVPPAVAAHWNKSVAGARGWPPGFAYDLDTALPRASTATPSLRSYANVTATTPRPIGSGHPSSSVEGEGRSPSLTPWRGTGWAALNSPLPGDGRGAPWPADTHGLLPGVMDERMWGQGRKGRGRRGHHGDGG
jgi:hypothetical protein